MILLRELRPMDIVKTGGKATEGVRQKFEPLADRVERLARNHGMVLASFAATIFLSALLLFSVQPMFAKMVLPKLGGSPSVWAVSMVFFQGLLLAGYCYAHLLNTYLGGRRAVLTHLALLALAVLALPIALPASGAEPPAGDAYFWLIGVLAAGVGIPFFAVSANAPLLQAWFARSGHPHAKDPYFLYAASNFGSLIALLGYPVLIEPMLGLKSQAGLWTAGFLALAMMIALAGSLLLLNAGKAEATAGANNGVAAAGAPTWAQRGGWVALAFVPSGLLVAFSSYVSTDIASAPFLWVMPLAMFLGTFILVFRKSGDELHHKLLMAQPAFVALVIYAIGGIGSDAWVITCATGVSAFFITTMICHRELYLARPQSSQLTEFYLWMSLGGVLGGVFSALIAPQIFSSIYEFPLLLALGLACRPRMISTLRAMKEEELFEVAVLTLVGLAGLIAAHFAYTKGVLPQLAEIRPLILGVIAALAVLTRNKPVHQVVFGIMLATSVWALPSVLTQGKAERSFFGVHRVVEFPDGSMRLLMHGTTIHGAQRLKDERGAPVKTPVPATYYHPKGPMAQGVGAARNLAKGGPLHVGVVGLGAGSLACYAEKSDAWRFFEIDPVVAKIARDTSSFNFLARCQPKSDIVLGDARLTLGKEANASYDYLVVDAFSSDSVPVHLLTREAFGLYLEKLKPDGILAIHLSNKHLELVSVAYSTLVTVADARVVFAWDKDLPKSIDALASRVIYVTKSEKAFQATAALPNRRQLPEADMNAWTDDYSNILAAMLKSRSE